MSPEYMFEDSFRNPRVLGPPGLISNNSNKKSCLHSQVPAGPAAGWSVAPLSALAGARGAAGPGAPGARGQG